jgi:serine phosphatase RsbU (regulator of sigma subunit)
MKIVSQKSRLGFWGLFNLGFGIFPCLLILAGLQQWQNRSLADLFQERAKMGIRVMQEMSPLIEPGVTFNRVLHGLLFDTPPGEDPEKHLYANLRWHQSLWGSDLEWFTHNGRFIAGKLVKYSAAELAALKPGLELLARAERIGERPRSDDFAISNRSAIEAIMGKFVFFDSPLMDGSGWQTFDRQRKASVLRYHQKRWVLVRVPWKSWTCRPFLQWLLEKRNREVEPGVRFGLVSEFHQPRVEFPGAEMASPGAVSAFLVYLKQREIGQIGQDSGWVFRPLSDSLCAVMEVSLVAVRSRQFRERLVAMAVLMVFLLVLAGFSFVFLVSHPDRLFPMAWKFGLIFLFVNGLPLSVLFFLGYEYLQQKRHALERETGEQVEQILSECDRNSFREIWRAENHLAGISHRIQRAIQDGMISDRGFLSELAQLVKGIPHSFFFLSSKDLRLFLLQCPELPGPQIFSRDSNYPQGIPFPGWENYPGMKSVSAGEMLVFSSATLRGIRELNQDPALEVVGMEKVEMFSEKIMNRSMDDVLNEGFRLLGRIRLLGLHSAGRFFWINLFSSTGKKPYEFFAWMKINYLLFHAFLEKEMNRLQALYPEWVFFCDFRHQLHFPASSPRFSPSNELLGATEMGGIPFVAQTTSLNGEEHLAFGYGCQELSQAYLFALVPTAPMDRAINRIRRGLITVFLLSLFFSAAIAQFLVHRFLRPISELTIAAQAIARKDFDTKPSWRGNDELGLLVEDFRGMMTDLEKLSLSRVVQEALLPSARLEAGEMVVWGRSIPMGELGGDYFDYFPVGDRRLGLFFGDVAGHGLPAAIIMAMAKGAIANASHLADCPAEMIRFLNSIILLPPGGRKRFMMTGIHLLANGADGTIRFTSAGQSYPILVSARTRTARYLATTSQPLGITPRARFGTWEGKLEMGDTLVLFTDGAVETSNEQEVVVGYETWLSWVQDTCYGDLEEMYQKLTERHLAHRGTMPAQDDVTLVFLGRRETRNPGP